MKEGWPEGTHHAVSIPLEERLSIHGPRFMVEREGVRRAKRIATARRRHTTSRLSLAFHPLLLARQAKSGPGRALPGRKDEYGL
jgi:hypothetical protein